MDFIKDSWTNDLNGASKTCRGTCAYMATPNSLKPLLYRTNWRSRFFSLFIKLIFIFLRQFVSDKEIFYQQEILSSIFGNLTTWMIQTKPRRHVTTTLRYCDTLRHDNSATLRHTMLRHYHTTTRINYDDEMLTRHKATSLQDNKFQ